MSIARRSKKIKLMKYTKAYNKRANAMPRKAFRSKPVFHDFGYKTISETWKRNRRKAFRSRWVASLQYARPCGTKGPSCARTWVHACMHACIHAWKSCTTWCVPQYLLLHAHTHTRCRNSYGLCTWVVDDDDDDDDVYQCVRTSLSVCLCLYLCLCFYLIYIYFLYMYIYIYI